MAKDCGLAAVVCTKHAPVISHEGVVRAADIEALIHLVQTKVKEQTTIELMHEVYIIGDC
jgi:UDP-N-acetylmuramate dehydrogenase